MREQVRDGEDRIGRILADGHRHHGPILFGHHAVQGQGPGQPLVLADAAVVVGFELGDGAVLIERVLLEVEARGVAVGADQAKALAQGLFPPAGHKHGLALHDAKNRVGGEFAIRTFGETGLGQGPADVVDGFAFGLTGGEEGDVAVGELPHGCAIGFGRVSFPATLRFDGEGGFCLVFFGHDALGSFRGNKPS